MSDDETKESVTETDKSVARVTPMFLLFSIFLVLKLTEVIDWSWWFVTAPLWIPSAIIISVLSLIVAVVLTVIVVVLLIIACRKVLKACQ
jgi:hypothetical protein